MGQKLVGFSLSMCIKDILEGRVAQKDVVKLITGTLARDIQGWAYLAEHYGKNYWRSDPDKGVAIMYSLLAERRIFQPREFGLPPKNIAHGHWAKLNPEKEVC